MIHNNHYRQNYRRPAFTLVELLVTISVIAIMATFVMVASYSAMESAKEAKTKATITKLNNMIMAKYEGYRTRRVAVPNSEPFNDQNGNGMKDPSETFTDLNGNGVWDQFLPPQFTARMRLNCLRELMRMELPHRWSDILQNPENAIAIPAVNQAYRRRYYQVTNNGNNVPSNLKLHQSAECLFMIVTLGLTDELGGRDHFNEATIGDVDGDGFPEFLDGWGNPIRFLRWAPGFPSELQMGLEGSVTSASSADSFTCDARLQGNYLGHSVLFTSGSLKGQSRQVLKYDQATRTFGFDTPQPVPPPAPQVPVRQPQFPSTPSAGDTFVVRPPDPFDPRGVYPTNDQSMSTFALYPLIYSAGPDEIFDIATNCTDSLTTSNNPFAGENNTAAYPDGPFGTIKDLDATTRSGIQSPPNGVNNAADNIHNHLMETKANR